MTHTDEHNPWFLAPVPEHRLHRRFERKRQTPDARRAELRKTIVLNSRLMRDPENAWRLDNPEQNDRHLKLRLCLELSLMRETPRPELPGDRFEIEAAGIRLVHVGSGNQFIGKRIRARAA